MSYIKTKLVSITIQNKKVNLRLRENDEVCVMCVSVRVW